MPQLTNRARKDLEALPPPLKEKALEIIKRLDHEPARGKKLSGRLKSKRSARLGRSHRIIYSAASGSIIVLTIGARKDVYR